MGSSFDVNSFFFFKRNAIRFDIQFDYDLKLINF